jgi:hypothetical protein
MKGVELYGRVRYAVQIEGLSHRAAARQSRHSCTTGRKIRTVQKRRKRSGAVSATTSQRSSRTAPTPGATRSPHGALAKKRISRRCVRSRKVRCLFRLPTRLTMPSRSVTTIVLSEMPSGHDSTEELKGRAGTIASSPTSLPRRCPAACRIDFHARSQSFRQRVSEAFGYDGEELTRALESNPRFVEAPKTGSGVILVGAKASERWAKLRYVRLNVCVGMMEA